MYVVIAIQYVWNFFQIASKIPQHLLKMKWKWPLTLFDNNIP